ncbi:MAG: DUF2333 family protein [Desulfosudaceae bacterium]
MNNNQDFNNSSGKEFTLFAWWRIAVALIAAVLVLWIVLAVAGRFTSSPEPSGQTPSGQTTSPAKPTETANKAEHPDPAQGGARSEQTPPAATAAKGAETGSPETGSEKSSGESSGEGSGESSDKDSVAHPSKPVAPKAPDIKGLAFVNALIEPLDYELNERFWGWRPNDLIEFTDNVNNMQRGVLEVTRRATVRLAERISRTGSTDVLDPNLESAMNWFMVKSDSFWFPSAENKYNDGLNEIKQYRARLINGQASFHKRADNLIPLFRAFADLLGSCDENLVKQKENDGKPVSTFAADNYFYYAKGVAGAMIPILKAVSVDFHEVLVSRDGDETLHHAIHSCEVAASLDPWMVLESDLDGLLANHRANMAAHISHARFYLDVLINTLST